MNIKPDLDLNDGTYQILVSKTNKDVHLHDANDEAEMYLSADHFNKIAELMGFINPSKLEELIEEYKRKLKYCLEGDVMFSVECKHKIEVLNKLIDDSKNG